MGASLTAKSFRIFRLETALDTNETDFILFNDANDDDFKNTAKEGAYITTVKVGEPEGIGNNQAAEKPDGNVQPLGIVEDVYTITGWISNMRGNLDDGNNAFLQQLKRWKEDAQSIVDVFEAGVFGIVDSSDTTNSLTPIGTGENAIGLIFQDYTKTNDYNKNRVDFILIFRRSRGIDI